MNFGLWNFHYVRNRIPMAWCEVRLLRQITDGVDSPAWAKLAKVHVKWRVFWSNSGETDTAIYFKHDNQHNSGEP